MLLNYNLISLLTFSASFTIPSCICFILSFFLILNSIIHSISFPNLPEAPVFEYRLAEHLESKLLKSYLNLFVLNAYIQFVLVFFVFLALENDFESVKHGLNSTGIPLSKLTIEDLLNFL
jgi:hypothetical protein